LKILGDDARSHRQGWDQDQRDPYAIPVSRPSDRPGYACYSRGGRQPGREVDHHQRTSYQSEHGCGHVACGESSRSRPVPHEQFGKKERMILADMVGLVYYLGWICSDSNRKRQRSWKAPGAEVEDTKQSTDAKSRVSARTNVWLAGGVFFLYHTYVSCTSVLPPWLGH
jgi:hypothetical protein